MSEPVLPGLFSPPVHPVTEQARQLERVTAGIGAEIVDFWRLRLTTNPRFYAADLHRWVDQFHGRTAPGSADRVMRDLKKRKQINYRLVSRAQSLYEALPLAE